MESFPILRGWTFRELRIETTGNMLFDHLYHSGGLQRDDDGNVTPRHLVAWFLLSNDVGPAAGRFVVCCYFERTLKRKKPLVKKNFFSINPTNKQRPTTTTPIVRYLLTTTQQQQTPVHTTISSCWTTFLQLLGKRWLQKDCDRICFVSYKNCNLKTDISLFCDQIQIQNGNVGSK